MIVLQEPRIFEDVLSERLHGFDKDNCGRHERHQYHCKKILRQLRIEANERLLSDTDSSGSSNELDSESDEGCYLVLKQASRLRKRYLRRRRGVYAIYEPCHEKTGFVNMRKQRRRSASR